MRLVRWKPRRGEWNRAAATHLLRRSGFGARPGEAERFVEQGLEASLAEVLARDEHGSWRVEGVKALLPADDVDKLAAWWMSLILAGGAPLRERVTLMWHDHFATSNDKVDDARMMYRQNQLFREKGMGDFRELLHAVAKDPAMLVWLDGNENRGFLFDPLRVETEPPAILFLHGILANLMYRGPEMDQVWRPEALDFLQDVVDMTLTPDGEHRLNVYPREQDLLIEIPVGRNIYKRWLLFLQEQKDLGAISDWYAYSYDWRLDWRDIVNDGTLYAADCFTQTNGSFESKTCEQCASCVRLDDKIRELANPTETTKREVWHLAHSTGCLLAKTLITLMPYLRESLAGLILVASPQLGTPQSLLPLLHGEEKNFLGPVEEPLQVATRVAARTWPNPYALLPNRQYFQRVIDPVLVFEPKGLLGLTNRQITAWDARYAGAIASGPAMQDFLLGNPVRPRPFVTNTSVPDVLNSLQYFLGEQAHRLIEDFSGLDFDPPLPVYQVVGWGLETVRGIEYKPKLPVEVNLPLTLSDTIGHKTLDTCDGDITVVVPSARALTDATTFYLNLRRHNRGFQRSRRHRDILDVVPVQELIEAIVAGEESAVIEHISRSLPTEDCKGDRIRVRSPAEIHTFQDALHTGPIGFGSGEAEPGLI